MARTIFQAKSSFFSRYKSLIFGLTLLFLTIITLWSYSYSKPRLSHVETKIYLSPSDAIVSHNCTSVPNIPNLQYDPPKSTFYDDPALSYSIEDPIFDWDEKRREWLNHHPSFAARVLDRILLLTGSQPSVCTSPVGDHYLLRLFKNKADYCRIHGYDVFYSNTFFHPKMGSFWAKLPLIRAAMVAHPESEWIWWIDSDAVVTDMEFKLPLRRYKDFNLVVHGWPDLIYEKRSWVGVNAGVFLIRNCQWSMDFIDVWANMGPMSPDVDKWGRIEKETLPDKMFTASDDQSALIYLLVKEKEKWADKVFIEGDYYFQGYWVDIVHTYDNITIDYLEIEKGVRWLRKRHAEKEIEIYAKFREPYLEKAGYGKGSWRRPFVTHFTGCQPCSGNHNPMYKGDSCEVGMERALNFADNQVLRRYGFVRPDIRKFSNVSPIPFNFPA